MRGPGESRENAPCGFNVFFCCGLFRLFVKQQPGVQSVFFHGQQLSSSMEELDSVWDLLSRETVQLKAKVVSVSSEFTSMIARPDAGNEAGPEVAAEDPNNGDQDAQNNAGNKAGPEVAAENNAGNNAGNMPSSIRSVTT